MGDHGHIKFDAAIDRWAAMRENVYQHFKFTRTATRQVGAFAILLPLTVFATAYVYDNKYDWAGKTRGQSLLRNPPAPAADEE